MSHIKEINNEENTIKVDIEKLERLSCLKLNPDIVQEITKSIQGVITMINEIEKLKNPVVKETPYNKNILYAQSNEKLYSKSESVKGVHLEDGMFLAPKVIKK